MNERLAVSFKLAALKASALLVIMVAISITARGEQQQFVKSQGSEKPSLSTVYGRAIYHDSEQPVRRVGVVLRSLTSFGPEQLAATTNARGEFRIEGVPAGRYFIGVNGSGVVSTDSFIEIGDYSGSRHDLTDMRKYFEEIEVDGRTNKQVLIRARRGGVVTGKVSYANGDPAIDHPITILRRKRNRYSIFFTNDNTMRQRLITDDRGVFRISGLPTGDYIVGATPVIEHGELVNDSTLEANMVGSSLSMTFHPSTMLATDATPIRVDAGEDKAGIDITLADQELHTVSGVVRSRDNRQPLANAKVNIIRKETYENVGRVFWPYSNGMPGVTTDHLGRWRLREVPDGRYIIFVEPSSADPPSVTARYGKQRQEIEVSSRDVNNLVIELGGDATVSGKVIVENGRAPRGMYLGLTPEGSRDSLGDDGTVQPDGKFVIREVPPGRMYFVVYLGEESARLYIKSMTLNGRDLLREPLEIQAETKIEDVKIVLSPQVATLTIRVRSVVGEPVDNVELTLVPSDRARWERPEAQLLCTTDDQGKCTIFGAPQEYLVFILPRGVRGSTLEKDEIAERASGAVRVSLRPGESRIFDVVLPR